MAHSHNSEFIPYLTPVISEGLQNWDLRAIKKGFDEDPEARSREGMLSRLLLCVSNIKWKQAEPPTHLVDFPYECAAWALAEGANPNLSSLQSPLIEAVKQEDVRMCRILLESGANANPNDKRSIEPPLLIAIIKENEDLVSLLLSHGADPNQEYRSGPIWFMAVHPTRHQFISQLLEAGADMDARWAQSDTALHFWVEQLYEVRDFELDHCPPEVAVLIDHGIDINAKNHYNETASERAITIGHPQVAHLIQEYVAHREATLIPQSTPIIQSHRSTGPRL